MPPTMPLPTSSSTCSRAAPLGLTSSGVDIVASTAGAGNGARLAQPAAGQRGQRWWLLGQRAGALARYDRRPQPRRRGVVPDALAVGRRHTDLIEQLVHPAGTAGDLAARARQKAV